MSERSERLIPHHKQALLMPKVRKFGWQSPALEAQQNEVDRHRRLGRKPPSAARVAIEARTREHDRFLARIDLELDDVERRIDALAE